jgi:TetR/AcrR family transcriptional repressor of nem operon
VQEFDVAQELVQTVGANAMSYQHISKAVGIRKASIHHHFPARSEVQGNLVLSPWS